MTNEKMRTFTCSGLLERSFHFFEDIRNRKELCDVTFQVADESISAHRIIIAAAIPYFRDALLSKGTERDINVSSIADIDQQSFKSLIDFAYTQKVNIYTTNVRSLLAAACTLGVEEVRRACCDFLIDDLEINNALNIREIACDLRCFELLEDTEHYIKENFSEISQMKDFLYCSSSYVQELIIKDDLNVDNEERVFAAVLRWVKYSPEVRKTELPFLLRLVRMPLLEPVYLTRIMETEELIRTSLKCRELLDEARNYNLFPEVRKSKCRFPTKKRMAMKDNDGNLGSEAKCIYKLCLQLKHTVRCFDPERQYWTTKRSYVYNEDCGAACEAHGKMYFFVWGDTLEYDPRNDCSKYLSDVPTPRKSPSAASLKNKIYLCGGRVNGCASNSVECFDPAMNAWTKMSSMRIRRSAPNVVVLGEHIYVLGGYDGLSMHDSVERYDSARDKWKTVSPVSVKRWRAGAAALNGKIYVCGGSTKYGGGECTASAEMYNPVSNRWVFIKPMTIPRSWFFLLPCCGNLFALGGYDAKSKRVHTFDAYNPECDYWTFGASPDPDYFTTAAVVI